MNQTTAHWPRGFGAGLNDFQAYFSSDSNFAAAWNDIQAQLTAEGADASQVNLAKTALTNSFEQLATNIGVTGDQAIASAKSYVLMGQTVAGAVQTIQGLVQAAETGSIPTITSVFTGTLVGALVTAGALSAGIGAAIVGVVSGLLGILGNAGFFGQPSTDVDIAGCGSYPNRPVFMIGCVGIWNQLVCNGPVTTPFQVTPGSTQWRTFPNPNNTVDNVQAGQNDCTRTYSDRTIWYTINGSGLWKGCRWQGPGGTLDHPQMLDKRLVDIAFPNFAAVEALGSPEQLASAQQFGTADFQKAFIAAWKSNTEYALNGLKPQPDELVLIHLLRLWNRSHAGPSIEIGSGTASYLNTLILPAISQLSASDPLVSGQKLVVNVGPAAAPRRVVTLHIAAGALAPATASGPSTATKIVAGTAAVGGATLLTAAIYGYATGKALDAVFSGAWRGIKGWFR